MKTPISRCQPVTLLACVRTLFSLLLAAVLWIPQLARGVDVITYVVGRNHHFDQFAGVPVENAMGEAWEAGVNVYTTFTGSVASAAITLTSLSVTRPLANRGARFELSEYFDLKTKLDEIAPAGEYVVTISTLNDGIKTCPLQLTTDAYPNAPLILSTNEGARINPGLPFTLRWAPFVSGTTNDFIFVVASPSYGEGSTNFFVSPLPNQSFVLRGTNTQVTIPANSLPPDYSGYFKVGFFKAVDRNTTGYPGVAGYSGYGSITKVLFQTLAIPVVTRGLPATVTTNAGSTVTFSVQASGGLLNYQWRRDGTNIVGATNDFLTLSNVRSTNAGAYSVVISNPVGMVTNGPVFLVVVSGAPGSIDPDFSTGIGLNGAVRALAIRPDGRILAGGSFTTFNMVSRPRIVSLTAAGSLDTGFAPPSGVDNDVHALALQPDRKLLVGGSFNFIGGVQRPGLARLETNGIVDATFNTGSGIGGAVFAVALRSDGKIAIGGSFGGVNGTPRTRIALLNTNGTLDASFVASCNGDVRALAFLPDNRVLVGGAFTSVNGTNRPVIARLLANGALDPSFNAPTSITYNAYALAVQADGKIVVAGGFDRVGDLNVGRILRLNPDGSLDTTFKTGVGAGFNVRTLLLQPDNKIVIGGEFTGYDNLSQNRVARLNPDGSLDRTLNIGTGANSTVMSVAAQADGKILIGGFFTAFNTVASNYLARINSDPRSPVPAFSYQPVDQIAFAGEAVAFHAGAVCSLPVTYQWRINGVDIPNATSASLPLNGVQFADQAAYSVSVSSAGGTVGSTSASLIVQPQPRLLEHLAHRYSFSETPGASQVIDSIGNAHGAFLSAGAGEGFTGSGRLALAGLSGYVDLPDRIISPLTNLTIETWVTWNGPSNSQYQTIFYFAGGSSAFHLTPFSDFPTARLFFSTNITVIARPVLRDVPPPVGVPLHYAVVYHFDARISKLYLNGRLVAVGSAPSPLSGLNDINNWLGRANGAPNLNGVYDEFRIYDAALSDAAILNSYLAGPDVEQLTMTLSGTDLVLSWPLLSVPHALEYTADLAAAFQPFSYTPVTNTTTSTVTVTLPSAGPQKFYRLHKL